VKLVVITPFSEFDACWELPSPTLARKFPDNPRSSAARFRVKKLQIDPGGFVEIALDEGNEQRHSLFIVDRKK